MIAHGRIVAQLLVRNLEEDLVRDLKRRAGEHGVSVEEEHRRILRAALRGGAEADPKSFWQMLSEMPEVSDDSLFERERELPARATDPTLFED